MAPLQIKAIDTIFQTRIKFERERCMQAMLQFELSSSTYSSLQNKAMKEYGSLLSEIILAL